MHLAAAIPNFFILEQMEPQRELRDRASTVPIRFENGHFLLPEGPGLGVEPNLDVLREHRVPPAAAHRTAGFALPLDARRIAMRTDQHDHRRGDRRAALATAAPARAQQPIVLQWQTANLTESQYEPVWKATIAEFEAANPGVKIEPVLVARKDHWTKFVAAAQAKQGAVHRLGRPDDRRVQRLPAAARQVFRRPSPPISAARGATTC